MSIELTLSQLRKMFHDKKISHQLFTELEKMLLVAYKKGFVDGQKEPAERPNLRKRRH